MAIQMTRAEYEAKYGKPPAATSATQTQSAPVKMTRAEYNAKYGALQTPAQPGITDRGAGKLPVIKQLNQIGLGIGSGIGRAGIGLGETFLKGANVLNNAMSKVDKSIPKDQYKPAIEILAKGKQKIFIDPFKKELDTFGGKTGKTAADIAVFLSPSKQVTGAQQKITNLTDKIPKIGEFGRAIAGVVGRAIPEAVGAGASSLAITGGDTRQAKKDALLAGGLSAGFGLVGSAARGIKNKVLPSVLPSTTGIPKGAFDEIRTGKTNATPEQALQKSREAIYGLREKSTKMWQERLPQIADEFQGTRTGLSKQEIKKLQTIIDEFGVDEKYLPQNLKNMSALESMNLMKGLNELDGIAVTMSPRGAVVRAFKKELREKVLNSFGGKEGSVGQLWRDYAVKSKILENADAIVKAYKTNPTQTVTAKNRLMAIFDDNKPEFLKAIKDLEQEMGVNLTKDIASTKFTNIFPAGILKANGGLPTQAGIVDRFIKALLLPLTSPRLAGKLTAASEKEAGMIGKRIFGDYSERPMTNVQKATQIPTKSAAPQTNSTILPKSNKSPIKSIMPQSSGFGKNSMKRGFALPKVVAAGTGVGLGVIATAKAAKALGKTVYRRPEEAEQINTEPIKAAVPTEYKATDTPKSVPERYKEQFKKAATRFGVPEKVLAGVINHESRWDPKAFNPTDKDTGLGQHTPIYIETYKNKFEEIYGHAYDPYRPYDNIHMTALGLADLYKQLGNWDDAITAYNNGVFATKKMKAKGIKSKYLAKVKEAMQ